MKNPSFSIAAIIVSSLVLFGVIWYASQVPIAIQMGEASQKGPDDYLYRQRAYPHNQIDIQAYRAGVQQTMRARESASSRGASDWQSLGTTNVGGRVTDVALHPINPLVIYAATSVGGIFKTIDGGQSWSPIFDEAGFLSIGNIAIAPSNPSVLYAGTGEANGSATSGAFFGNGLYKSTDDGQNWQWMGLAESQHIGRIAIDPLNADRVFVATTGKLYGKDSQRGLYRTTDGGSSWEQILFVSDSTSCIDVLVNPQNSDIVYATTWERLRKPWQRSYGGPTSGIHRSTDGGDSWTQLTNGLPISDEQTGRIGIAISASNPNVLYASYTHDRIRNYFRGIYKTTDGGDSWVQTHDSDLVDVYASFGWFFGNLRVDPLDPDVVYVMGVQLFKTTDGGDSWQWITEDMHVDQHGLEINPFNTSNLVAGNDGGIYISNDGGLSWEHKNTLPITQFYTCAFDPSYPERLYGGTQDNGTIRTLTGGHDDWERILGGDGFYVLIDPTDNNYVYAEYQWGNLRRSVDGGENFMYALNGVDDTDRTNWNTPVVFDPNDPSVLYYGSNKLYRSDDRAANWTAISEDLTDGLHPSGSLAFGTISTIAVAPSDGQVIYVGTDDGNVQMTTDGGANWLNVSAGLPDRYVTRLAVFPDDANKVIVTLSGYRYIDYQPHVLLSEDGGTNWIDISANLPEVPVNAVLIDYDDQERLYVGNDMGVWVSYHSGQQWELLGNNLPSTIVNDLVMNRETRTLIAATFGRSMFSYELGEIVAAKELPSEALKLTIYPNPVLSQATIELRLDKAVEGVDLALIDQQGRRVQAIFSGNLAEGNHQIAFEVRPSIAAGQYLVRLQSAERTAASLLHIVR